MNPPAIILGGTGNAVSVARSLAAAGVEVYALGTGTWDPVRYSRACRHYVATEGGETTQRRWLEWLEQGPHGAVVLPCDDDGVELIARHRADLVDRGYRPYEADDAVLLAMIDKSATHELAAKAGVPTPRTVTVKNMDGLTKAIDEIGLPCALKPLHSHVFRRRIGRVKAVVVHDADELSRTFARFSAQGVALLATEIIPGDDARFASYYSYLDEAGEPLFHFTKRKVRQFPTGFGGACYEVSQWDEEVATLGLRFFQGIGLRGLANVEFKRDPRDGGLKLIECNHRFTASNELIRIAGIDLALFVYNRLVGRATPETRTYRDGVHLWYPIEDFRSFWSSRRSGQTTVGAWLGSFDRPHFPIFRWSDPTPTLSNVSRVFNRVRSRHRAVRSRPGSQLNPL